jgi:carbonic anhydrase
LEVLDDVVQQPGGAETARYAESFAGPLPLPPAKHLAVIPCMDARLDVYRILAL